jgi:DNA-binding transcriptional ArsR family regulator
MDPKIIKGLFNPVRIKIIFVLNAKQECTTKELQDELQDIPQASLYRHINSLVKYGVIEVIKEEKKRGALERTYRLKYDPYDKMQEQAIKGDKDSVGEVFYYYIMTLLAEFTTYLNKETTNLVEDGVGFRSFPMYVTEEEHQAFVNDLGAIIQNHMQHPSRKDRRLRKFSFVYMPGEES